VTAFETITTIMNDKKFEMMYPVDDLHKLREALVKVHDNASWVDCSKDDYESYVKACLLFGVKPHSLLKE
jgi:hypothetical protein